MDANLLLALTVDTHVHHEPAGGWFGRLKAPFATCPSTQGSLLRLRLLLGESRSFPEAMVVLQALVQHPRHIFWADCVDYAGIPIRGIQGHRQVTDAYLASLARHHGGRLATFDRGLAALHADVAELVS